MLVSSTSLEIRKPKFTAHGKNQQTPFASEVEIHFLVEMGCMSLTACDRIGLYSALKIAASIDTLKVTLQKQCFYFLSAVKNKNIAAHYKKDQVFFILNNR